MVKVQWISGRILTSFTSARYYQCGNFGRSLVTAVDADLTIRDAGDFEDISINVTTNIDSTARTFRLQVNGSNVNLAVSITGSTTGFFEDTATDSVVADDEVRYEMEGTTGVLDIDINMIGCTFDATTNSILRNVSSILTHTLEDTEYLGINSSTAISTTEADHEYLMNSGGTFKNLQVNASVNTKDGASVFTVRKNQGDGNGTVSVTASTTGIFIDTSNTDTAAGGDDFTIKVDTTASTTGTLSCITGLDFVGTSDLLFYTNWGNDTTTVQTGNKFFKINDETEDSDESTESNAQYESIGDTFTLKNARVEVSANTLAIIDIIDPDADDGLGGWSGSFADIDQPPSDANDIQSANDPSADTARFTLQNISDPLSSSGHTMRMRADRNNNKTCELKWALLQGASTVIHEETITDLNKNSITDYEYTLTAGEADNITDYDDLRFRVIATTSGGGPATAALVYNFQLDLPSATPLDAKWRLRKNAGDGNQVIEIDTSTGVLEDSSNTDEITDEDDICYELDTNATSGSITIKHWDILADYGVAPVAPVEQTQGTIVG